MEREQTTIRLPAELKEQLQREAEIDYFILYPRFFASATSF